MKESAACVRGGGTSTADKNRQSLARLQGSSYARPLAQTRHLPLQSQEQSTCSACARVSPARPRVRRFYSEAVRISLVGVFRDVYVQNGRASEENERDIVAYVPPISKKKKLQKLPTSPIKVGYTTTHACTARMTYGWEALVLCPLSSSRVFSVLRFLKVTKRHLTGRSHRSVEALTHEGFLRLLAARSAHCRVWECFCAGEKKILRSFSPEHPWRSSRWIPSR